MDRQTIQALGTHIGTQRSVVFSKPGRDVALLAVVQIVWFLMLTQLEPRFFIIHLYQMIPYGAILVLVGYSLERWAYAIGALVSIFWLGLSYMADLLSAAVERLWAPGNSYTADNLVAVLVLATAALAVLMIVVCRVHWVKGDSERRANRRIFLLSLAIVGAYYLVLGHWFWDMIRDV